MTATLPNVRPQCLRSTCGNLARPRLAGSVQPLYCSHECRIAEKGHRQRQRRDDIRRGVATAIQVISSPDTCLRAECTNPPRPPKRPGSRPLYCSRSCARRQGWNNRDRRIRYGAHGATLDDYDRLFAEQQGKCAICGSTNSGASNNTRFAFDHCHETGESRGLLCYQCNVGLGSFQDDIARLRSAIAYLVKHKSNELNGLESAISP